MGAVFPCNRFQREKISLDRKRVVVTQLRIRRVREDRKIVLAFGAQPKSERTQKLVIGPFTDAGLSVRRDVRAVVSAEGRLESASPRERRAFSFLVCVATDAISGARKIVASYDDRILGIRSCWRQGGELQYDQNNGRGPANLRDCCLVPWQFRSSLSGSYEVGKIACQRA